MNTPVLTNNRVPAMADDAIAKARALEAITSQMPQVPIPTDHVLHGGLYARTIVIPAGVLLTGAFIKVPTLLVFDGHAHVNTTGEGLELCGRHVLAASAGRRQVFMAHEDTSLTMVFATSATTVDQAEEEFTNEAHLLASRNADAVNTITITGE